jgi:hypothetical protein
MDNSLQLISVNISLSNVTHFDLLPTAPVFSQPRRLCLCHEKLIDTMAGGPKYQYPKEVWSPAGGWWAYPKNWRINTFMAYVALACITVPVFIIGERNTVRKSAPKLPIPWRPDLKPEP